MIQPLPNKISKAFVYITQKLKIGLYTAQTKLNSDITYSLIILLISFGLHYRFWGGEIIMGHDSRWHFAWINHFSKQLSEGIPYPRWLAELNYGYGSPTFVYYPPLPYYIAHIFKSFLGFSLPHTLAAMYSLISFTCGISTYLYKRCDWGKLAAFIAAICFIVAPYNLYTHYERMAFSSAFSTIWLVLGLWFADRIRQDKRYFWGIVLVSTGMALSNLPMLLILTVAWITYILISHYKTGFRSIILSFLAMALGWGVSSFYLLPVLFEREWVKVSEVIGKAAKSGILTQLVDTAPFEEQHHLIAITQFWDLDIYLYLFISLWLIIILFEKERKYKTFVFLAFGFTIVSGLMHRISLPFWSSAPILYYVQFPWRMLPITALIFSLSLGYFAYINNSQKHWNKLAGAIIILVCLVLRTQVTINYIAGTPSVQNPVPWTQPDDASGAWVYSERPESLMLKDVAEYQPMGAKTPRPHMPEAIFKGEYELEHWDSYYRRISTTSTTASPLTVRLYCYPAWQQRVDEQAWSQVTCSEDQLVQVKLPEGKHIVELRYSSTPALRWGTTLTLISITILALLAI